MSRSSHSINAWPLLPRSAASWGGSRPTDEPARAAIDAMAGVAAALLALRWLAPHSGLANEFAALVALWGGLGGMALTAAIVILLAAMPLVMPLMGAFGALRDIALWAFDHAVHLALVMSCTGMLGAIALAGKVSEPALWFAGHAAFLLICHRARLWLAGGRMA